MRQSSASCVAIGGVALVFLVHATPSGDAAVFCSSAAELRRQTHRVSNPNSFAYFFLPARQSGAAFCYLELCCYVGEARHLVFAPPSTLLLVSWLARARTTRVVLTTTVFPFNVAFALACVQPILA
jgi:hypothetical protein